MSERKAPKKQAPAAPAAEYVHPSTLKPDPKNPRRHKVDEVASSIQRFGFGAPILARAANRQVIAGHGRLEAALKLGCESVPVRFLEISAKEARALMLADNQLGGEWDDAGLREVMLSLQADDVDVTGLGWSEDELKALLAEAGTDEGTDEGPGEVPAIPVSVPGEVYELGPHRLLCGDSTDAGAVAAFLGDDKPTVLILDPPFDVDYAPWEPAPDVRLAMIWARGATGLRWIGERVGDAPLWGVSTLAFSGQARGWARPEWPCLIHEVVYVLRRGEGRGAKCRPGPARAYDLRLTNDDRPFSFYEGLASRRNDMSWAKNPATYAVFLCMAHDGEIVYDPCAGSGASLLATHTAGNVWRGVEQQPKWCDMIRKRWTELALESGKEPGSGALK
jgi:hypothetical protein